MLRWTGYLTQSIYLFVKLTCFVFLWNEIQPEIYSTRGLSIDGEMTIIFGGSSSNFSLCSSRYQKCMLKRRKLISYYPAPRICPDRQRAPSRRGSAWDPSSAWPRAGCWGCQCPGPASASRTPGASTNINLPQEIVCGRNLPETYFYGKHDCKETGSNEDWP